MTRPMRTARPRSRRSTTRHHGRSGGPGGPQWRSASHPRIWPRGRFWHNRNTPNDVEEGALIKDDLQNPAKERVMKGIPRLRARLAAGAGVAVAAILLPTA